ncbi:MAG: hypothetical protein E5W70_08180 [Mesorhizobium sp.]|nr:MAG: hypothetical protein E5W70_08180 [Mesorhizobium sp.]
MGYRYGAGDQAQGAAPALAWSGAAPFAPGFCNSAGSPICTYGYPKLPYANFSAITQVDI